MFAAYPDLKFVFNELNKPDEVVDPHPDVPLVIPANQAPSIEFENVSFQYPAKTNATAKPMIFNKLSFKAPQGKKVVFVSESGAGKTTIFNLLFGHYKPTEGTIKIDGQDISKVSLKSLQSNIRVFGQNPGLFKGTVRENICFGSSDPDKITDDMIWENARKAHLYDFLKELKLDTDVGERGDALSGGQKQKISILRGLFKESRIMLLDEITAPFDSQSAIDVMKGMHEASEGMTTLTITHKLTEAQNADHIIVISEGKVLNQGTHAELLESCALYQKLWSSYVSKDESSVSNISICSN
jgi:ABC-type multidrug transport system fused ATPase/permease subunit